METNETVAGILLGIASVIEITFSLALMVGWITFNPHGLIGILSGIAFAWVGYILSISSRKESA